MAGGSNRLRPSPCSCLANSPFFEVRRSRGRFQPKVCKRTPKLVARNDRGTVTVVTMDLMASTDRAESPSSASVPEPRRWTRPLTSARPGTRYRPRPRKRPGGKRCGDPECDLRAVDCPGSRGARAHDRTLHRVPPRIPNRSTLFRRRDRSGRPLTIPRGTGLSLSVPYRRLGTGDRRADLSAPRSQTKVHKPPFARGEDC